MPSACSPTYLLLICGTHWPTSDSASDASPSRIWFSCWSAASFGLSVVGGGAVAVGGAAVVGAAVVGAVVGATVVVGAAVVVVAGTVVVATVVAATVVATVVVALSPSSPPRVRA